MKLIYTPTSPFVRKVRICSFELGLELELVDCKCHPIQRDPDIVARNPLGQVPTLITDDDMVIHDSRVICQYLDDHAGGSLYPGKPDAWRVLTEESMANGALDAAALTRIEQALRPSELQWQAWLAALDGKIRSSLAHFEASAGGFEGRVDIGTITIACLLGYLDFRMASLGWRDGHPALAAWFATFAERASMQRSLPPA